MGYEYAGEHSMSHNKIIGRRGLDKKRGESLKGVSEMSHMGK